MHRFTDLNWKRSNSLKKIREKYMLMVLKGNLCIFMWFEIALDGQAFIISTF